MNVLNSILVITAAVLAFSPPSMAQSADDLYSLRNQNDIGLSAGVQFTMPFGGQHRSESDNQARLGLTLSVDREYGSRSSAILERSTFNLLEAGFWQSGEPNFMIGGQNVYRPLFDPLYADDEKEGDKNGGGDTTLLIIGGVVVATGIATVVLIEETKDGIECTASLGFDCDN